MRPFLRKLPAYGVAIVTTAIILLGLYVAVGRRQGVSSKQLSGTVQNDILKEYVARGNYIFPPRPSMRLTTDLFAYCHERLPRWNMARTGEAA